MIAMLKQEVGLDTKLNALQYAYLLSAIPGLPLANTAAFALSGVEGNLEHRKGTQDLENASGVSINELRAAAANSPALQQELDKIDSSMLSSLSGSVASSVGSAIGSGIGSFLIPIPFVGTLVGGGVGAIAGGGLLGAAMSSGDSNAVQTVTTLAEARQQGQTIQAEAVFAALADNLPDTQREFLKKQMQDALGTTDFGEILASGDEYKIEQLRQFMKDHDSAIRASTGVAFDRKDPHKTVSEQYAELINAGKLDARALLINMSNAPLLAKMAYEREQMQQQVAMANTDDVRGSAGFGPRKPSESALG